MKDRDLAQLTGLMPPLALEAPGKLKVKKDGREFGIYELALTPASSLEVNFCGPASQGFFEKIKEGLSRLPSGFESQIILRREKPVAREGDSQVFPTTGLKSSAYLIETFSSKTPHASGLAQILHDIGQDLRPLEPSGYSGLLNAFLGKRSNEPLDRLPDLLWEGDHLRTSNGDCIKVASLTDPPQHTWPGLIQCLTEYQDEYILSFKLRVPDKAKSRRELETKRRVTHALSVRKVDELSDLGSGATLTSSEETLVRITQGKECLASISLALIMSGPDLEGLERRLGALAADATTSTGMGLFVEGIGSLPVYRSQLPGAKSLAVRELTFLSGNAAHLLPILQDYSRHQDPSLLTVASRCDERSHLNLFSKNNLSFNALVAGTTGSGKSFLMNAILLALKEETPDADITIFDIGGSYRKVVASLGGFYETLDAQKAKSLVLGHLRSRAVSADGFSRSFFENLCGQGTHMTHSHRVAIEDLLNHFAGQTYQFRSLIEEAESRTDRVYKEIALWLKPYQSWDKIEATSEISRASVRAFDLKNLEKEPVLQRLVILVLTQDIWDRLESGKAPRTLTVFDEVWKFFVHARDRLEEMYRVYRKYGAGITCVTQTLSDYGEDAFGKLIFSLSYNRLLLQGAASTDVLEKMLDASPSDVTRFLSIASKKNEFSEFLQLTPKFSQIHRLYASPKLFDLANSENINARQNKEPV